MYDDREPPPKRSRDINFSNSSKLPTELEKFETTSTTKLLDLNDDCLDKLFDYMDVIELCSITQVCKRLQQLTALFFNRKYSEFDISALFPNRLISHQQATDILRLFGSIIESVTVTTNSFTNYEAVGHVEEELLKDIVECCGEKLHTLKLSNFFFTSHAVESLNMLSKSLQSLLLCGCRLGVDCIFHLSNFLSLKRLTITNTINCYPLMDLFPALEYLRLQDVYVPSKFIMRHFLVTHKQLKRFLLFPCDHTSSDLFRSIGKHMENLTEFQFGGDLVIRSKSLKKIHENILHLSELKKLQSLNWECSDVSIRNILAKIVSNGIDMKRLYISYCTVDDETIETIVKMKNLENLGLVHTTGLKNQHLIKIARELTQLTELMWQQKDTGDTVNVLKEILCNAKKLMVLRINFGSFCLHSLLYSEILDIVKQRRNGIKLTIKIYSTDLPDAIPQQTLHMNKNWLIIEYVKWEQLREIHF